MTGQPAIVRPARPGAALIAGGIAGAAVAATVLNAVIAAVAHAAGASHDFQPLQLQTFTFLTVIGVLAGAAGWAVVRARSSRPRALLRVLVPAVLAVSLIPDVLVGAGDQPGTSWGAVAALMVMHLAVAAVAVPAYLRVMPLRADSPRG